MKSTTVCFSGHRPEKLPFEGEPTNPCIIKLKSLLYKEIYDSIMDGYTTFICGLARGIDLWAGQIVLDLKNEFPHIELVSVKPYENHGQSFRGSDRFMLSNIIYQSDKVITIGETYTRDCMKKRNYYMVDNSSKLIAFVSDYRSGTGQTIRYAQRQSLEVRIFNIEQLTNSTLDF